MFRILFILFAAAEARNSAFIFFTMNMKRAVSNGVVVIPLAKSDSLPFYLYPNLV